jgi:hypothetical protein
MYMIVCVIDQPANLNRILEAWQKNGITGVTILESTGLGRLSQHPHIAMRYMFGSSSPERGNITLFAVVENEATVRLCLEVSEAVIGNFNDPNTGIFAAWPLEITKGLSGKQPY